MNEVVEEIHKILEQWGITHKFKFEHPEEAQTVLIALQQPDIDSIVCNPTENSIAIMYKDDPSQLN